MPDKLNDETSAEEKKDVVSETEKTEHESNEYPNLVTSDGEKLEDMRRWLYH